VAYIRESSSWADRRRRRQQITLAVIVVLLLAAGGVGYAFWSGALAPPDAGTAAAPPPCTASVAPPPAPSKVVVNVYNATKHAGLAGKTATQLGLRSFAVGKVANDPLHAKVSGVAVVRHGKKGLAQARMIALQVKGATLATDKRTSAAVDLVIGAKFAGLRSLDEVRAAEPTPTCQPVSPSSTTRPTATKSTAKVTPKATTSTKRKR